MRFLLVDSLLYWFISFNNQLRFRSATNDGITFRVGFHTKLKKAMAVFCDKSELSLEKAIFKYEGKRMKDDDTPFSLGITSLLQEAIDDGEDADQFCVQIDVSAG